MSNGRIPIKSTDCAGCHEFAPRTDTFTCWGGPFCEHHPDGKDYEGHDRYIPSEWVTQVVGKKYRGPCGEGEFECTGYDIRCGFWMKDTATGSVRNVSERAIDRTFHTIR